MLLIGLPPAAAYFVLEVQVATAKIPRYILGLLGMNVAPLFIRS